MVAQKIPAYANRIKALRQKYALTQSQLADLLGVSYASVNRWENDQTRPNALAWQMIEKAEVLGIDFLSEPAPQAIKEERAAYQAGISNEPDLDFSAPPEAVLAIAEGYRLAYGHQFNPAFASEISLIDPLPHQRIAVYEHMLPKPRLRFLLADDAGAGKTIMSGLYIREMLARRLIRRVLIVPPAGLVGNWESELRTLFNLHFRIVSGADSRRGNPFLDSDSNLAIISVDTLASERSFARLQEPETRPYDLVIFDEAHKLSADREPDFRIRKTGRYRLAEALAGCPIEPAKSRRWQLNWSVRHLVLLTATPHMGKDFPYYCLWRLLEPEALSTLDAFHAYPADARSTHFIRRTKEEMVSFEGKPIYPTRISDTLSYELTQGLISEQELYDQATAYIEYYYNRARVLNRSAARLAMSIFQRRLASSTWAMIRSLERRLERLNQLIEDIRSGKITLEQLKASQHKLGEEVYDVLDEKTADEESFEEGEDGQGGHEEQEIGEQKTLAGVVATSLAELEAECMRVQDLLTLARQVFERGHESKYDKLLEILRDARFKDEKMIIFTEHRDTLDFLTRRLEAEGFHGQVVRIHGGMPYPKREEAVAAFRKPLSEGGVKYLVATDAAGEGINLQVCWLMVNYDIPWNPARLEQRMGRIHRYGQEHDPVFILNLVAGKTREGRVMRTLLEKLERIRKELKSDKVFDVVGRLFEGVSLRAYFEQMTTDEGADQALKAIEGFLTPEQVRAIQDRERRQYGDGGDVKRELPRLQKEMEFETYRRLVPGYVRNFFVRAAPLVDIGHEGDLNNTFALRPLEPGALDALWPALEAYPPEQRHRFSFERSQDNSQVVFFHPGERFFDHFWGHIIHRLAAQALSGGVFIDPAATQPYLFHLAEVCVIRQADDEIDALTIEETVESRLVAMREEKDGSLHPCPVESLLLLRGGSGIPADSLGLAASARLRLPGVEENIRRSILQSMTSAHQEQLAQDLPQREAFIRKGFDYQESELLSARARYTEKANAGDAHARGELTRIKARQRSLRTQREAALRALRREPELITDGPVTFLAHALVIPSTDPEDKKHRDDAIEAIATQVVIAYEETAGAVVKDVHTPELSRAAGMGDHPGFDLLSTRLNGEKRLIEIKGRSRSGNIDISDNEWSRANIERSKYWLYVVYDCATPAPRLIRIQDPWGRLMAKVRGYTLDEQMIFDAAESDEDWIAE